MCEPAKTLSPTKRGDTQYTLAEDFELTHNCAEQSLRREVSGTAQEAQQPVTTVGAVSNAWTASACSRVASLKKWHALIAHFDAQLLICGIWRGKSSYSGRLRGRSISAVREGAANISGWGGLLSTSRLPSGNPGIGCLVPFNPTKESAVNAEPNGVPRGIRTPVTAVKGRCPRPG